MIELRAATLDDVPVLEQWDQQPHVIAASGSDDEGDWRDELSDVPDWYDCLIAEVNGRPVGVVQIIDPAREETHYWGDCGPNLRAIDIWIGDAEDLGQGYGRQMMARALDRCFSDPSVYAILIDPLMKNVRAQRFYRRLGFMEVGPRRFGADDCLVLRLERATWLQRTHA